jgi:hypothetical protein
MTAVWPITNKFAYQNKIIENDFKQAAAFTYHTQAGAPGA